NGLPAALSAGKFTATVPIQEGNNLITAAARDASGRSATASVTVTLDTTPPSLSAVVSPAPNASGAKRTNVTVTFTATDALSGVATVTRPVSLTSEAANQKINGTATDRAGNGSTVSATVYLDKTPPALEITSPANGATVRTPEVTISGTVTDALSGVAGVT